MKPDKSLGRSIDLRSLGILLVCAFISTAALAASPETYDAEIQPNAGFTEAKFRLRVFDTKPVRGILVLVPGYGQDGRGEIDDPQWERFAKKFNLALLGCSMQGPNYCLAEWGTGDALLSACREFAKQANHPELETAPLLLWGFSAGGQFNYHFVCWKPERVAAFVVNKGAYYTTLPNAQARAVPGLFIFGERDTELRKQNITNAYKKGHQDGAVWTLVSEPNTAHELGKSPQMAEAFFEKALKQKLNAATRESKTPTLP